MNSKLTISVLGLDAEVQQRVGMAANLLAASGIKALLMPWDGTRRDLLIANASDAYASSALALMRRRGGKSLLIGAATDDAGDSLPTSVQVTELVRRIQHLLAQTAPAEVTAPVQTGISGLLALCADPANVGRDIHARSGPFTIVIQRRASRVLALSHSDLALAQSRLINARWELQDDGSLPDKPLEVSRGLDEFLIRGCEAVEQQLPRLTGSYALSAWPDLGTLPDHTDALRMSAALVRKSWSIDELALSCKVEPLRANAFCWAMLGAGLLLSSSPPPLYGDAVAAPRASKSILSRLARRFGLT